MGRYYNGDIDGKFMFAVQPSNAGERFFARETEPEYIEYEISRDNYSEIVEELDKIKASGSVDRVQDMVDKEWNTVDFLLTKRRQRISAQKENGVSDEDIREYADYQLGMKIKVWFDENPEENYLNFMAEI